MPCTLEVGDYVLSPSMCVERKSLPDLIESLRNGRLVTQMQNMCRHYKIPILLIEFERDKAFGIQNPADVPRDLNFNTTQGRLALLIWRFPKMRLMWSRSLHMTARMFADWKYAEEEPTVEVASKVGVPQGADAGERNSVNQPAIDMLRRLPASRIATTGGGCSRLRRRVSGGPRRAHHGAHAGDTGGPEAGANSVRVSSRAVPRAHDGQVTRGEESTLQNVPLPRRREKRRVVMSLNSKALHIAEGSLTFSRAASADPTTFAPPLPQDGFLQDRAQELQPRLQVQRILQRKHRGRASALFPRRCFPSSFLKILTNASHPPGRATSESPRSPIPPMVTPPRTGGTSPA